MPSTQLELDQLQNWAASAADQDDDVSLKPDEATILRYQDLFGCTHEEAVQKAQGHQSDLRDLVSVSAASHAAASGPHQANKQKPPKAAAYLVKLEGILSDPEAVRVAAGLDKAPVVVSGSNDSGEAASFCRLDNGEAKATVFEYLAAKGHSFRPTFVQITRADKSLSRVSAAPTLGLDTTLPQNRPGSCSVDFLPLQNQYPVFYFFYGMLAMPEELSLVLSLPAPPQYRPAVIRGGKLTSDMILVDAASTSQQESFVQGQAYLVETEDQETSLRFAVTYKYEVVRCKIELLDSGGIVDGLTFRYRYADI